MLSILKKSISLYKRKGAEMLLLEIFKNHRWPSSLFSYSRQDILLASSIKPPPKRLLNNRYKIIEAKKQDINSFIALKEEEEGFKSGQYECKFNNTLNFIKSDNSLYLVYDESKVIGYLYLYRGERELHFSDDIPNHVFMSSDDKVAFFGFGYVSLKYRMKGVFPLMMNYAVKCNPFVDVFVSDISPLNAISINSNRRIGFSVVGNIKLFRVFGVFPVWRINFNNKTSYKFSKHICIPVDVLFGGKSTWHVNN